MRHPSPFGNPRKPKVDVVLKVVKACIPNGFKFGTLTCSLKIFPKSADKAASSIRKPAMSDQAATETKGNSKLHTNILMITALLALCAAAGKYGYHLGLQSAGEKYQDKINQLSAKSGKSDALLAEQSAENISLKNQVTQLTAADKTHQAKLDDYANQIAALNELAGTANSCSFAKDQVVSLQNQLDLNRVLIPGQPSQPMYEYSREVVTDRLKTYQAILEKCAH
ncbi:hypothetical protein [Paraburkholderia sp. Cpub6]|uniref:hypothetical protein n=1 Tax=Paraburkholderia sp. Cpub6 TaxID=2723094 RepID=UPI00161F8466|nr:hypothetical protein [Paraburkholderia sp. Cpub6]MBB5463836.1 hypothetical protein [Paraburkholderia sp. Cpub6]